MGMILIRRLRRGLRRIRIDGDVVVRKVEIGGGFAC